MTIKIMIQLKKTNLTQILLNVFVFSNHIFQLVKIICMGLSAPKCVENAVMMKRVMLSTERVTMAVTRDGRRRCAQ